ncbi:ATP synthase F1 subunit epsilon [Mangrovicoccus algicola]|uniref:ATP synthase epsilon chain n=1 Tax=Mangrovicoccus algicola TaxID=2771008 RepID=A0A8J6Z829_9RHOB|nr:ATP synthase F1 subunit epsilon [Mangrovicoccus algicola]MBE3637541.1 ATP synthase F1 subunit epsilon [Mangrovicoccus algicola]
MAAETFQFDLVSPERSLASFQASAVQLPGSEGDLTAMAGHWPMITTLRPGMARVTVDGNVLEFAVVGGFAEITAGNVTVLAERAFEKGDEARAALEKMLADARTEAEAAKGPERDIATELVYDFVHLLENMQ